MNPEPDQTQLCGGQVKLRKGIYYLSFSYLFSPVPGLSHFILSSDNLFSATFRMINDGLNINPYYFHKDQHFLN